MPAFENTLLACLLAFPMTQHFVPLHRPGHRRGGEQTCVQRWEIRGQIARN